MNSTARAALETLYNTLLPAVTTTQAIDPGLYCQTRSLVVELARVLGKPSPVATRADRRRERKSVLQ